MNNLKWCGEEGVTGSELGGGTRGRRTLEEYNRRFQDDTHEMCDDDDDDDGDYHGGMTG